MSSAARAMAVACLLAAGCAAGGREPHRRPPGAAPTPEAVSLLGEPLFAPPLAPERRRELEERLSQARTLWERNPADADAIIWLGRRTAYLGRFREAVEIFSEGLRRHPENPRLYRHRGHRYVTLRKFDLAEADLERAARLIEGSPDEIEPDGLPNARNIPTSTLQSNIWYHLGLARYLRGDFARALEAYRRGIAVSRSPDNLVSMGHWLYMTLRRLGRDAEAADVLRRIRDDLDVIENGDYYRLLRMYQGKLAPEDVLKESGAADSVGGATAGYGIGNWHLYNGRREEALRLFRQVVRGTQWPAFGHVAAEAEVARLEGRAPSQPASSRP
ncbi:MAG: tetratricopeptide repeat protein [Thermoanaerobaculia bacterium]